MAAPLEKTRTPGVFKRGARYVVIYRDENGRQRQRSARTYDDARLLKSRLTAEVAAGQHVAASPVTFADYARDWLTRHIGRDGGLREQTRDDYRRDLERAIEFFGERRRIDRIGPRDVAAYVAWLVDDDAQRRRHAQRVERHAAENRARQARGEAPLPRLGRPRIPLADASVRRIVAALKSCLATAVREELIGRNPAAAVVLPKRDEQRRIDAGTDHDDEDVKALTTDELAMFLAIVPARWRAFFDVLAATGLRWSEIIALRWRDVRLDGSTPHVHVKRACVRGRMGPPKSRYGRRKVPLGDTLVERLRAHRSASEWARDDDLVFAATNGRPLDYSNTRRDVLGPTAAEAGVPWIGMHTFRHTCATRLFADGRNAVQVQRWLGHHSPAFTLSVYVHLLDDDMGGPLEPVQRRQGVSRVSARTTDTARNRAGAFAPDSSE